MTDARNKPLALDVKVPSVDLSYPVLVGSGLLDRMGSELRRHQPSAQMVGLISDEHVMPLYGERVQASLEKEGLGVVPITVAAGEGSKSSAVLLELVGKMVDAGLGRNDVVVALGGGVVGDLAGLAGALFMRGIAFLQCPTSLLAQVDASVGGKVAIDLSQGKNLLGAFHFPETVVIDPDVLGTLPDRELSCGLAEMLKHAALFSAEHFEDLVGGADAVFSRDSAVIARLVATSVALKAACVSRDPLERGAAGKGRVLLNLGHTVGHAIEVAAGYEMLHGEAVALGLRAAARLSERRGLAEGGLEGRMVQALERLRLPVDLDAWLDGPSRRAVETALGHDKKRSSGTITYIALRAVGNPQVVSLTPEEILDSLRVGGKRAPGPA